MMRSWRVVGEASINMVMETETMSTIMTMVTRKVIIMVKVNAIRMVIISTKLEDLIDR